MDVINKFMVKGFLNFLQYFGINSTYFNFISIFFNSCQCGVNQAKKMFLFISGA